MEITIETLDNFLSDLIQYKNLAELAKKQFEEEKEKLIDFLEKNNMNEFIGLEHKLSYKDVQQSRVDTTALKREYPDLADKFTVSKTSKRLNLA